VTVCSLCILVLERDVMLADHIVHHVCQHCPQYSTAYYLASTCESRFRSTFFSSTSRQNPLALWSPLKRVRQHNPRWALKFVRSLFSVGRRNVVDPSNSSGWTVALRDEFDVYECAGNDFIMDLIGEIEVPPYVPSGTAYFLTTTDALRSNMSSSARQKWPSQLVNCSCLFLMCSTVWFV